MSKDDILGATLSGRRGYRKKSSKGWWGALAVLLVMAAVVAGFHFGGKVLLKQQADQRAVEAVALPVPTEDQPKVTEWAVKSNHQTITYRFAVFPNGLECLVSTRHMSCNWAKYNAEQRAKE